MYIFIDIYLLYYIHYPFCFPLLIVYRHHLKMPRIKLIINLAAVRGFRDGISISQRIETPVKA